jgi:uncharacterized lipoprotein YajG
MKFGFWSSFCFSTTTAASRADLMISIWDRIAASVCMLTGVAETSSTILFMPSSISTRVDAVNVGGVVWR